jgi:zinc-ribbon domain
MFCPRCGQQCSSDVRFCSRCGLPLNVIAKITENQGMPIGAPGAGPSTRTTRPKSLRIGTIIMLASLVLTPLFIGWSVVADGPAPLLVPLTLFLTGLCTVLYSRAFKDDVPVAYPIQPYQVVNPPKPHLLVLPERQSIDGIRPRKVNTSDMVEPPSVTDHTTQFFD